MKKGMIICFSVFFAVFGVLLFFDADNANAGSVDFAGEWACSSYLADGPHGEAMAGVVRLRIDSWGNATGSGYAAAGLADEKVIFVECTVTGKVSWPKDGFIVIEGTLMYGEHDPITIKEGCIGMKKVPLDGYQEMQCIDYQSDATETEQTLTLLQCKKSLFEVNLISS